MHHHRKDIIDIVFKTTNGKEDQLLGESAIEIKNDSNLLMMVAFFCRNLHCHLIGYKKPQRVKSAASVLPNQATVPPAINTPTMTPSSPTSSSSSDQPIITHENLSTRRPTGVGGNASSGTVESNGHGNGIDRNLAAGASASAPPTPPRAGADCADGLAEKSIPRTESSSGKLVKIEVGETNNNNGEHALKRPRDSEELSLSSKRPRNNIGDAVPLASRGAGDDLALAPENEGLLTEALEQNSLLRQKYAYIDSILPLLS